MLYLNDIADVFAYLSFQQSATTEKSLYWYCLRSLVAVFYLNDTVSYSLKNGAAIKPSRQLSILLATARAAWLNLFEEVIALVINEDECREVLYLDFPDSLHAELGVLHALDALDVVLREDSSRTTD